MQTLLSYFSWRGRTNRRRFWVSTSAYFYFWLLLMPATMPRFWIEGFKGTAANIIFLCVVVPPTVVFFWLMCVMPLVRRLHDRNRLAWWCLPFFVVPQCLDKAVNAYFAGADKSIACKLLGLVVLIPWFWGVVEVGFLKGSEGDNRFGADPLRRPGWIKRLRAAAYASS